MDLSTAQQLLTIADAAKRLGVSTKTLRRWGKQGKIIPQRTLGNQRRYSISQIEDLRNENSNLKSPALPARLPDGQAGRQIAKPQLKTQNFISGKTLRRLWGNQIEEAAKVTPPRWLQDSSDGEGIGGRAGVKVFQAHPVFFLLAGFSFVFLVLSSSLYAYFHLKLNKQLEAQKAFVLPTIVPKTSSLSQSSFGISKPSVLGVETANHNFVFNVNVPAYFN